MKKLSILLTLILCFTGVVKANEMELPPEVRAFYRNPDGSCVQCSIGMNGAYLNNINAATLLWDTKYGDAVRGGSWPGRVASYAKERGLKIYNVTGTDWQFMKSWMEWAVKTGRYAAIGAGRAHFQTLYGKDGETWKVCNNNSTYKIDQYSEDSFRRLHEASGYWMVILQDVPAPPHPRYVKWW